MRGVPGAIRPETVSLPRPDARDVAVPAEGGSLRQRYARLAAVTVEQTQFDAFGDLRKNGEIRSPSVPRGAERKRLPRSDSDRLTRRTGVGRSGGGAVHVRSCLQARRRTCDARARLRTFAAALHD